MPKTVCAARWIQHKIREWVPGRRASNWERPTAVSVEQKCGTTSRWRLAECRCCRVSALETGMQCSDRYGVARPLRHWWTVTASLKRTRLFTVCCCVVESRSVLANSRSAAAHRCLHRLKHLTDVPCHAEQMEVTEPLRSGGSIIFHFIYGCSAISSVLGHCWSGVRKSIWPVKIVWWYGYLSGVRCRLFAYSPANGTAIPKPHHLLPQWNILSSTGLPRMSWKRGR